MKRKRIDIIISLLLAIALWVYVVGEMDPTMRQTFHGVTIQYANEATMHDIGLGVASYGEQELSVTVTGARSRITALQATDIQAVVDLSEAAKGTNQLTIRVSLPSGLEVLVGRNNRENDILTLEMANRGDYWLHTKDIPGSHVILRTEGREITETAIYEAAALAALNSKARNSENVPVDYVPVRYVKKPSGAKPGKVIFTHNRTVYVDPGEPDEK